MPNMLKQKRSIIYLVILIFIFNLIITSCKRKNVTELNNNSTMSTTSSTILPSTSISGTKQSSKATTTEPVESEIQIPTELNNFQELISPNFRISKVSTKILKAKDGVIYTEKYDIYSKEKDAIDNSQKITKTIRFKHDGKDVELNLSYVEKENKKVFIPDPYNESFVIRSIKENDKAILEYNDDLFYIDIDKNIVTPLLNDYYGGYGKSIFTELAMKYKDGENDEYPLSWGSNPIINKDETKMVFCTNRNGLLGESDSSSTWTKDLLTGEEKILLHGKKEEIGVKRNLGALGNNCLGWDEQNRVYFKGSSEIIKVNPETEEIKLIATNVSDARLAGNYIVMSIMMEEVHIYNILNDTIQEIKPKVYNISTLDCSPDNNYVIFSYYKQPDSPNRDLGIIDLDKNETHYLDIPDNIAYEWLSWSDNQQILISYRYLENRDKKESMFIDLILADELNNNAMATLPTLSANETKQTGDATTTVPVESETQIPTKLSNFQEMISPIFRISKASTKILRANDGVIYTVPDNDDMQKQKDSFDFKTGEPTYKLKYNVYSKDKNAIDNSQKITKTITFNYDGKDVELNVSYVEEKNKKVFLPEPNSESFIIQSIKASDKAILDFNKDLFYVDLEKNIVTPMLNDNYGTYSKKSLKELAKSYRDKIHLDSEGYYLIWGRHFNISRDGTKMVFLSNRNGLLGDSDQYGTWLKDLQTGEEKLLLNGDKEEIGLEDIGCYGSNCLGWDEQDFVYFLGFGNVIKVNPDTGEIKLITSGVKTAKLVGNYIVSCFKNEVKLFNTVEDTNQIIKPDADRICIINSYSLDENYVAFSYYDKRYSLHRNIGLIDLKKNEVHYVNIPDDIILDTLSFIDNNQAIISYYFLNDKDNIESIFVDLIF